jgi:hypothetical protein
VSRVTVKDARAVTALIARAMRAPEGPLWTRDASGQNRATVGAVFLHEGSASCGVSWRIARMVNTDGGEATLVRGATCAELVDRAHAWLDGYREGFERAAVEREEAQS